MRIPVAEAWWVKRVLDSGAHGVMVPLLQNAAQVKEVVSWTRYPPKGIRGFGPMYTHHTFGGTCTAEEYKKGADNVVRYGFSDLPTGIKQQELRSSL